MGRRKQQLFPMTRQFYPNLVQILCGRKMLEYQCDAWSSNVERIREEEVQSHKKGNVNISKYEYKYIQKFYFDSLCIHIQRLHVYIDIYTHL